MIAQSLIALVLLATPVAAETITRTVPIQRVSCPDVRDVLASLDGIALRTGRRSATEGYALLTKGEKGEMRGLLVVVTAACQIKGKIVPGEFVLGELKRFGQRV
jgi:hypothetical protein